MFTFNKKNILILGLTVLLLSSCAKRSAYYTSSSNLGSVIQQKVSTYSNSESVRNPLPFIENANSDYKKKNPNLVTLKYKLMAETPFAFYRSTAYIFYKDIASNSLITSNIKIPIQGDLHLENIGTHKTQSNLVFYDLNDFDESFTGSYTWDLARCAVSIQLAADENKFNNDDRDELVDSFLDSYSSYIKSYKKNGISQLSKPIPSDDLSKPVKNLVDGIKQYLHKDFLEKYTANNKFIIGDKFYSINKDTATKILAGLKEYTSKRKEPATFYKVKDIAGYIAGTGSLGCYRYAILLEGRSNASSDDIILEFKEASLPSGVNAGANVSGNQASRIVKAAKYFVPSIDPYYDVTKIDSTDFYAREVIEKDKVNLSKLTKLSDFKNYLDTVALVVARSHARSGKVENINNDIDNYSKEIKKFAKNYLDQVYSDYNVFKKSVK